MSTESFIIKAIVITVLFMLITLTPKAHAAQMCTTSIAVTCKCNSCEGKSCEGPDYAYS